MLKQDKNYLKVKENSSDIEKNCLNLQTLKTHKISYSNQKKYNI